MVGVVCSAWLDGRFIELRTRMLLLRSHLRALAPVVILVVVVAVALVSPTLVLAQSAPSPPGDGGGGDTCFLGFICGNPATWLQQTVTNILTDVLSGIVNDFGDAVVNFVNQVNFLTRTPENLSYDNDLVKQYATAAQVLADGLLAVLVLVSGYNVMLRPYISATYAGHLEILPRLLLGGILINTAFWWCRLAIDANNAVCGVFGAPSVAGLVATILRGATDHVSGLLMLLIATVMAVLLVIQQLMRLALVDVLFILAPLAAVLWILPQTQVWGRLWGRLFIGTVFAQAVQVLSLRLGFNLATGLPLLGAAGLLQPLLGVAVLALVLKIPGLMGGSGAGGNIVANLIGTATGAVLGSGVGVAVRGVVGSGTRTATRATTRSS
jgi:hypothetical protein